MIILESGAVVTGCSMPLVCTAGYWFDFDFT